MMRIAVALLIALAGCAPRTRIGDRLINQSSLTNGRSTLTGPQPAPVTPSSSSNP
jgi:hypothetical protein